MTPNTLADQIKIQTEMKLEVLQVTSQIAEIHRAYVMDGVSTAPARRAERWARLKHLELELYKINQEIKREKLKAQQLKAHSEISILSTLITAAGFGHLVAEARAQALAAIESAGLMPAYQAK